MLYVDDLSPTVLSSPSLWMNEEIVLEMLHTFAEVSQQIKGEGLGFSTR